MGPQDGKDDRQHPNDEAQQQDGGGHSGEGAGSAMEAMLRKRQMRVDPQSDAGSTTTQQQDGKRAEE